MKRKFFSLLLVLSLVITLSLPAYAATPSFKIPNITIPDISDNIKIELPDDFWDKWFDEHPLPEITIKPETPVISYAKYVHRTPYYGMSKHLEIQWNKIENADSYEVLITKADGTTISYNTTNNLIYDKNTDCPKIYVSSTSTWTAATVQVRAINNNQMSDWSSPVKISCDKLH